MELDLKGSVFLKPKNLWRTLRVRHKFLGFLHKRRPCAGFSASANGLKTALL